MSPGEVSLTREEFDAGDTCQEIYETGGWSKGSQWPLEAAPTQHPNVRVSTACSKLYLQLFYFTGFV